MNIRKIEKLTQLVLLLTLLASLATSIIALVKYNNLFETTLLDASINYQIYALLYIGQTILLCTIIILTVKLMQNTHKNFNFSDGNYYLLVTIASCLFIYGISPSFYALLDIGDKYSEVLNKESMSYTLIIDLGIVINVLSTIYLKSQKIKKENDYTI